jgi:hypothetical protein
MGELINKYELSGMHSLQGAKKVNAQSLSENVNATRKLKQMCEAESIILQLILNKYCVQPTTHSTGLSLPDGGHLIRSLSLTIIMNLK